tara:strand:+ start:48 stop:1184 length:1137 start_codon:yes stop_codon:yes gene_type:complete
LGKIKVNIFQHMNNFFYNFIIFRTDRLGDFIIHSRPIYELKIKYPKSHITVVCSDLNEKIISNYSFIDEVIIYNKKDSFLIKLKSFLKIIQKKYYAAFIIDGKKFSHICNIFIRSKNKLGLVYTTQKRIFLFKYWIKKPFHFYNLIFFNKYEVFTSKNSLVQAENLCQKYINIFRDFNNKTIKTSTKYIFETNKICEENYRKIVNLINYKEYLLIHFDEKWIDINGIDEHLIKSIENFQNNTGKKIILTAYNNKFNYYKNLKKHFNYIDCSKEVNLSKTSNNKSKIVILDNLELFLFERFIKYSIASISCHSGFMVQVAGANNSTIIDIINQKDKIWYDCWRPKNTIHYFIYKSELERKIDLNEIFLKIKKIIDIANV